jgi:hypothetical protein
MMMTILSPSNHRNRVNPKTKLAAPLQSMGRPKKTEEKNLKKREGSEKEKGQIN